MVRTARIECAPSPRGDGPYITHPLVRDMIDG
jgi:hypothetical protein